MKNTKCCSVDGCGRSVHGRGLCGKHYQTFKLYGVPVRDRLELMREAFGSRVERRGPDECWPWIGPVGSSGYGIFNTWACYPSGRHATTAHRVAYFFHHGAEIPVGLMGRHACDFKLCCNGEHILPGTALENSADAVERGLIQHGAGHYMNRTPEKRLYGARNPARQHPERLPRGETSPRSKLTDDQVREIYRLAQTDMPQHDIGARFSVGQCTVSEIKTRKRWKHILPQ